MPVELSRRAALTTALTGAAVAGIAAARGSEATTRTLPRTTDSALHAARRLTYGATPALVAHLRQVGLSAWLDEQLAATPDLGGTVASLGASSLPLPSSVLMSAKADLVTDLQAATFARAVWGERQLAEVLVEVWSNHLSVFAESPEVGALKLADDRDVVRTHALGTFREMLAASLQSPAMLTYLSNRWSRAPRPNENYARELLELHTVGVRAGYRQRDVRDAAKVLTGLSVDDNGLFTYRPQWHVTGPVRVLGWRHANADAAQGLEVALSLAAYLAAHPSTAHRIAEKLVRRFVSDTPPPGLVESAARVYRASDTAIVPVVRHVVLSKEFAEAADRKTQRPLEWAAFAARALGLQQAPDMHVHGAGVVRLLERLGQTPFGWRPPDGYPDTSPAWATSASLLSRWNIAQELVSGAAPGFQAFDVDAFVGTPVPTTVAALVDRVTGRVLCRPARPQLRTALVRSTGRKAGAVLDQAAVRALAPGLAALALSSPEAQVR
ncbi:MAG TPA: DUF1800 domain-containing protein [Mycobacteriales bacterium]|nr:DUF1800 domain-containing protein [Mycobacteriales bacterium]